MPVLSSCPGLYLFIYFNPGVVSLNFMLHTVSYTSHGKEILVPYFPVGPLDSGCFVLCYDLLYDLLYLGCFKKGKKFNNNEYFKAKLGAH